jgi:hypothetical protein
LSSLAPKNLLIYYGYPSLINGSTAIAGAAAQLGRYDDVVLGDRLELTSHPDHQNTVAILANAQMAHTTVFGYIDLGVTTQDLSLATIKARIDDWQATGAKGIFLDDFGYDFGTTRARQNAAVDYAHSKGLPVVANAFVPADAFGNQVDPVHNPSGTATNLGASDFYLYESFQISSGAYVNESAWQTKATALQGYQAQIGFQVFAVTTNKSMDGYSQNKFFYSWYSALLYGYAAVGWGEYQFAADDNHAPFRARPAINPGTAYTGAVMNANPVFTRDTDLGQILVNTATHAFSFTSGGASPPAPPGVPPSTTRADERFAGPGHLAGSAFPSPDNEEEAPSAAEGIMASFPPPGWVGPWSSLDAGKAGVDAWGLEELGADQADARTG